MSATALPSFAPHFALRMWDNDSSIFVEIPAKIKTNPPYILSYPRTESGLQKALDFMANRRRDTSGAVQWSVPKEQTSLKPRIGTPVQQAHAEAVLRAMKLIP